MSRPPTTNQKILRDLSTTKSREYWKFVEETAREVRSWPDWLVGTGLGVRLERDINTSHNKKPHRDGGVRRSKVVRELG